MNTSGPVGFGPLGLPANVIRSPNMHQHMNGGGGPGSNLSFQNALNSTVSDGSGIRGHGGGLLNIGGGHHFDQLTTFAHGLLSSPRSMTPFLNNLNGLNAKP